MPSHPKRVRSAPLADGYQFGDAGKPAIGIRFLQSFDIKANVQPPLRMDWNVIEGDPDAHLGAVEDDLRIDRPKR